MNKFTKISATLLTAATIGLPLASATASAATTNPTQTAVSTSNVKVTTPKANSKTVTGTAPAGSKVTIKNDDGKVIGSATANSQGRYTAKVSQTLQANEKLNVAVKKGTRTVTVKPTVRATTKKTSLSVYSVKSTSSYVYGKATANSTVSVRTSAGTRIAYGKATSTGSFKLKLSRHYAKGTTLKVTAAHSGYTSTTKTITVK